MGQIRSRSGRRVGLALGPRSHTPVIYLGAGMKEVEDHWSKLLLYTHCLTLHAEGQFRYKKPTNNLWKITRMGERERKREREEPGCAHMIVHACYGVWLVWETKISCINSWHIYAQIGSFACKSWNLCMNFLLTLLLCTKLVVFYTAGLHYCILFY